MPPAAPKNRPVSPPAPDMDFRALFERAPGAFLVLRPDGPRYTIVAVTDNYLAATHTRREQIVGLGLFEAFPDPPNDPEATGTSALGASLARATASARADMMAVQRYPIRRPDGAWEERYWSPVNTPLLDDEGRVIALIHAVRDVTELVRLRKSESDALVERDAGVERERLIKQLQAAERRLRDLFEQAPVAVAVMTGPELVYTVASQRYIEMLGGRALIGRPLRDALPELAGQSVIETVQRVLETGIPFSQRERMISLDKHGTGTLEEYWFNVGYQPLRDADGKYYAVASTAYEVTDQVRARRELEHSRLRAERSATRLTKLQSLSTALSAVIDADHVADVVLREGLPALGAAGGAVVLVRPSGGTNEPGFELLKIVGFDEARIGAWRRYPLDAGSPGGDVMKTGEAVFIESVAEWSRYPALATLMATHGFVGYACVPLRLHGKVTGLYTATYVGAHTFSTEERLCFGAFADQCAQALERARLYAEASKARVAAESAQRDAEDANRAKSEFLAVMSHELRTPLNAIGGYAELMQLGIHGAVTPEQLVALERIQRSQRHLLGLINGVLNYSRVEAGVVHYEIADVQLDETLGTCEALVAPQVRARGLTLVNTGCPPGAAVRVDREKLQQVVLNLLSNAVKFTPPGGRVSIECDAGPDGVMSIRVADTGRGIDSSQIERVFQPFVQVDAGLTRTQDGVGLGLAISRDLARGMGGDLTVTSEPGVGSTFTLTVPIAEPIGAAALQR